MRLFPVLFVFIAQVVVPSAQAAFQGGINGRTADILSQDELSVDFGVNQSQEADYLGGRINFKPSLGLMFYADFGSIDLHAASTNSFGVRSEVLIDSSVVSLGAYLQMADGEGSEWFSLPVALRLGYQNADSNGSVGNNSAAFEARVLSAEVLVSGESPIEFTDVVHADWYASAGWTKIETGADVNVNLFGFQVPQNGSAANTEFTVAVGLVVPFNSFQFYLGAEKIDQTYFGAGLRLKLK